MSSRSDEYRQMIEDILAEDATCRAAGLPGLDLEEIQELRDMIARAQRKAMAADMPKSLEIAQKLLGDSAHG